MGRKSNTIRITCQQMFGFLGQTGGHSIFSRAMFSFLTSIGKHIGNHEKCKQRTQLPAIWNRKPCGL